MWSLRVAAVVAWAAWAKELKVGRAAVAAVASRKRRRSIDFMDARVRALGGDGKRMELGVVRGAQRQKQIPRGNDRKKGKGKSGGRLLRGSTERKATAKAVGQGWKRCCAGACRGRDF